MGMDVRQNPLMPIVNAGSTIVNGTCSTVRGMLDGAIEFAGDTMGQVRGLFPASSSNTNTYSLAPIGYSNNSYSSGNMNNNYPAGAGQSLTFGQGGMQTVQNGMNGLTNLLSGTIQGVSNFAGILSNEMKRISNDFRREAYYMQPTDMMRMYHNTWGGWGWGCTNRWHALSIMDPFPNYYGSFYAWGMPYYQNYYSPPVPVSNCNCHSGQNYGYSPNNNYGNNYSGYHPYDAAFSPPVSADSRQELEKLLYPERFANNGNGQTQANGSNGNAQAQTPLPDKELAPSWVSDIQDKVDKKQPVSAEEQGLLDGYKKLNNQYSPYKTDGQGNVIRDADGKPQQLNSFGEEMIDIQNALEEKQTDAVLNKLKSMPLEKVAALEAHYQEVTGKNLREEIKESCSWTGFGWLNLNTDKSKLILDYLDQAALTNPRNMASALRQAINDHRMFGLGIDDDRVAKLFTMMKDKPGFKKAVSYEYKRITGSVLSSDIGGKWFISDKNKWITKDL